MKKLTLNLEALRVETFEAERPPEPRGTVQGHFTSGPIACQDQCMTGGGCSDFGCPSEQCSGAACNSLAGCVSYERTCGCTIDFC